MDRVVYNSFIGGVDLVDVNLVALSVIRHQAPNGPWKVNMSFTCDTTEANEEGFTALANCQLDVMHHSNAPEENETLALTVKCSFELSYTIAHGTDYTKEVLEKFAEINVPVNAWPYVRELISSTTVRLGYPALTIGTYKVGMGEQQ